MRSFVKNFRTVKVSKLTNDSNCSVVELNRTQGAFHAKSTPKICQIYAKILKDCTEKCKDPRRRSGITCAECSLESNRTQFVWMRVVSFD